MNLRAIDRGVFYLVIGLTFLFVTGCSGRVTPQRYLKWYEKNKEKYSVKIERNGVSATVSCEPAQYFAARDMQANPKLDPDTAMKRYEKSLFFTLDVSANNPGQTSILLQRDGRQGYSANVNKNMFERDKDIFLLCGNDTIRMADYEFERNWGLGTGDVFLMMFSKSKIDKKKSQCHFIARELAPELGTIDINLSRFQNESNQHLKKQKA